MDLVLLVLVLCVVGYAVHLMTTHIPMAPEWATAIRVVAILALLFYLLSRFVRLPNVLP